LEQPAFFLAGLDSNGGVARILEGYPDSSKTEKFKEGQV